MSRSILTNQGKAELLSVWKDSEIFAVFGGGNTDWFTDRVTTAPFLVNNTLDLGFPYITTVVVQNAGATVTYTLGTDYSVNLTTGIVTRLSGGAILAEAQVKVSFHVNAPPCPVDVTTVLNPIGYKKVTAKSYAELDDEGSVVVDTGTFGLVMTPTPHLYLAITLLAGEFLGTTVRQIGFVRGLTRAEGVNGALGLLTPQQVATPGTLFALKNREPQVRDGITEHVYQRVISL